MTNILFLDSYVYDSSGFATPTITKKKKPHIPHVGTKSNWTWVNGGPFLDTS